MELVAEIDQLDQQRFRARCLAPFTSLGKRILQLKYAAVFTPRTHLKMTSPSDRITPDTRTTTLLKLPLISVRPSGA